MPQHPSHPAVPGQGRRRRSWRQSPLLAAAVFAACGPGPLAEAGGHRLTVDAAARLIATHGTVSGDSQVVRVVAELWVDYTLLSAQLEDDGTLASLDVALAIEQPLNEAMMGRLRGRSGPRGHDRHGRGAHRPFRHRDARCARNRIADPPPLPPRRHRAAARQRAPGRRGAPPASRRGRRLRHAGPQLQRRSGERVARRQHGDLRAGADARPGRQRRLQPPARRARRTRRGRTSATISCASTLSTCPGSTWWATSSAAAFGRSGSRGPKTSTSPRSTRRTD